MFAQFRAALAFSILIGLIVGLPARGQRPVNGSLEKIAIRVSEGTELSFDLSPDGRSIVFDLLGQLWLVPAQGGKARPLTDAVRDTAEDFDPSFAPDGRRILFRGERNGRTGLWLLNLDSGVPHQLTQLSDPDGFDGNASWSADGRLIAFTHFAPPSSTDKRGRTIISMLDAVSAATVEIGVTGMPEGDLSDPVSVQSRNEFAFVEHKPASGRGGRVWIVTAGKPTPLTSESAQVQAPSFTADGRRMAYFAPDSNGRTQVWVQEINNGVADGAPRRVTSHNDVTSTRIRWFPNGKEFLYSADGRLWRVSASGGQPLEIPFTAEVSFNRTRTELPPARFPEPGQRQPARGFMGLALSPSGRQIAVLALGKLWIIPVGGSARAVAAVPFEATALAWAPDEAEVAWSAGVADHEDLFATDLKTGVTRKVTSLPGREIFPTYSPDGRYLAFAHLKEDGVLRIVDAKATTVADVKETRELGSFGVHWTSPPQWSPESDGLLVFGGAVSRQSGPAVFVTLSGQRQTVTRFPDAPIFLSWIRQNRILFVRHDRLWQATFNRSGMVADPKPIGSDAALYASSSRNGSLLFVSEGGLCLRAPNGTERRLGWPIAYTPPTAEAILIRNARIIDGTGGPITAARDILIQRGRIARIAAAGTISSAGTRVLEAGGRIVMPGLMDLHAHLYRPDLLPGFLYFGITTVRDQGSSMAPLVAYADAIAAGALPGPRVGYGGFQFYSDWTFDEEQGRGIEPEADPNHVARSVSLAQAFGAQHIKTRTFRRWDINAHMIREAHRRGLRVTGHCSHQLPLVAAGMDAKEHTGFCGSRGSTYLYEDLVQLYRAADIGVVPTITYLELAVRLNERPAFLDDDAEIAPLLPARENFEWMIKLSPVVRKNWARDVQRWRESVARLSRAGVTIGTGTDVWQLPTGVHLELEQLVAAGLTPMEAIHAGTGGAAHILGAEKDLGTIEVGKWADLILLDGDPLVDIRNTRRIWHVVQYGRLVDRPAIVKLVRPR
jgi:imidazolonepropionase-like amidohydrolase/Tol biopolymer transport system component